MKIALLLTLLALSVTGSARASGPTTIDISTNDAGVTYTLHDYDARMEKANVTPDEIETWIRKRHHHRPDEMVIIHPDDRTTFKTVFEMLRRIKAAGVKKYSVVTDEDARRNTIFGFTDKVLSDPPPVRK